VGETLKTDVRAPKRTSHQAGVPPSDWPQRHNVLLWVTYFCYAVTTALLLQKLVLPMSPSLHAGHGLLHADAILFHQQALALADRVRQAGWSAWSPWPAGGGSGNVAILAALYVFFGPDPALLIPINAALHALGGLLIFLIGRRLCPDRVGLWGGLAASALFVMFPSAVVWYGQLHKDSFSIAGILLVVYALAGPPPKDRRDLLAAAGCTASGIALVATVRPYYLKLLAIAALAAWLTAALAALSRRPAAKSRLIGPSLVVALLALGALFIRSDNPALEGTQYDDLPTLTAGFEWHNSSWLPHILDHQAELAAKTRYGLIRYNRQVGARTLIDGDVVLRSVGDIARYAPRALQVAALAPFPTGWLAKTSLPVMLAVAETAVWYLLAPGILAALLRRRSS